MTILGKKIERKKRLLLYIYHVEILELLVALNNIRASIGMHATVGCNCNCEVCSFHEVGCIGYLCMYSRTIAL